MTEGQRKDIVKKYYSDVNGCGRCDHDLALHGYRSNIDNTMPMHGWEAPTNDQRKARMKARRSEVEARRAERLQGEG